MTEDDCERSVLASIPDAVLVVDPSGVVVILNIAAQSLLGVSCQNAVGKFWHQLVSLEDEAEATTLATLLATTIRERRAAIHDGDSVVRRSDGTAVPANFKITPYIDSRGNVTGAVMVIRDVTKRRSAEQALRCDEKYHRDLERVSRIIARTLDTSETVRAVVHSLLEVFGVDRAWLMYPCDPNASSYRIHVEATRPEYPGAFEEGTEISMDLPTAFVIQSVLANPIPIAHEDLQSTGHKTAQQFQIKSQMMIGLHPKVDKPWMLGLHQCAYTRRWSAEEKRLFRDIGERLTDAITNQLLFRRLEHDVARRKETEHALSAALREHTRLIDATPDIVFKMDLDGHLLKWNRSLEVVTGLDSDRLQNRPVRGLFPAHERPALDLAIHECLQEGQAETEATLLGADGTALPHHWIAAAIRDAAGNVAGLTGFGRNIAEQRATEQRLRQAAAVFENTLEGVVIADAQARIVGVNQAFTKLTGYSETDVLEKPLGVLGWRDGKNCDQSMWAHVKQQGQWQGEISANNKTGDIYPARLSLSSVRNEDGRITSYVGLFADITVLKQSQLRLEHLAHHDALTDLPNRLMFDAHLNQALEKARSEDAIAALLFIDLDGFKKVNDAEGHEFGDRLLREVARRLVGNVRESRGVSRLSGDEFTIVLDGIDDFEQSIPVAERILAVLSEPFSIDGRIVRISASIGISIYPFDGLDATTLVKAADAAMYRAKGLGKNKYQFYLNCPVKRIR